MGAQDQCEADKKYVLVPPDGGWGYVICVAATINFIALTAFVPCFGMIFNGLFLELGMGSTDVTLLTGVSAMSSAISAFLSGPMLKFMSMRKLALVASAMCTGGALGTAFSNSQALLIFCQGVLQSFGLGIHFNLNCTALNDYFVKKKLVSISIVNTITAAASMVAPLVVEWSKVTFGLQGTLHMITAVTAATFVGSSLLQPVAWHMKKVEAETQPDTEIKELIEKLKEENVAETPVIKLKDPEKVDDLFADQNSLKKGVSKGNSVLNVIKNYLDWPLLKGYLMTSTCYGISICLFTENTFVFFLPQYLYDRKWSNDNVAFAFSLLGFGDIATRAVLIFSSVALQKLGSHFLYIAGLVIGVTMKLALLWVSEYKATLALITLCGIARCTVAVLFPLVLAESVSPELFPSAFGINMAIFGFSSIILGPLIGALRDVTGDYASMFYALAVVLAAVAIAMSVEQFKRRRRTNKAKALTTINKD